MSRICKIALLVVIVGAAWPGVRVRAVAPAAAAATAVLESAALRVEVTAEPYSYAVIEKATGQALLRQSRTMFVVGALVKKDADTLQRRRPVIRRTEPISRARWVDGPLPSARVVLIQGKPSGPA